MNELALFAGAGGGILAGHLLGWRTVCAVEIEDYPRRVLLQRQADGLLPRFPIWDDIRTFDGKPWRERVDVISGGFPCQDISIAGKGAGLDGERSGLWTEMARIIGEIRPSFVFVENSPMLTFRGLGTVLGDLSELGFNAKWGVIGADSVGFQHRRNRIWIVAYRDSPVVRLLQRSNIKNRKRWCPEIGSKSRVNFLVAHDGTTPPSWRCEGLQIETRPILRGNSDGVSFLLDRIKTVGNAQIPTVAAFAWKVLSDTI